MKNKFFAIASLVASLVALQSGAAEAGYGCRTTTVVHHPVTVVQPVVSSTVVVAPVPVASTVVLAPKAIKIPQGSVLRLKANFLGKEAGQVFLATGSVSVACQVIEWNPNFVIIHLPDLAVVRETEGKIVIVTNEGTLKRKVDVIIAPTPDVEVVANDEFVPKAPTEVLGN